MEKEKFIELFCHVISLDIEKGHMNWSLSEASRRSGFKRSLVYHYFQNKKELFWEAINALGKVLAGTDPDQMQNWSNRDLFASTNSSRKILTRFPGLLAFYFLHRNADNEIGARIRELESMGIKKREVYFKDCDSNTARALYFLQMGISLNFTGQTSPSSDEQDKIALGLVRWPSFNLREERA